MNDLHILGAGLLIDSIIQAVSAFSISSLIMRGIQVNFIESVSKFIESTSSLRSLDMTCIQNVVFKVFRDQT